MQCHRLFVNLARDDLMIRNSGMETKRRRPTQVTMDLGPLKQPWLDWCEAQRVKPTDAFKQIVSRLVSRRANADEKASLGVEDVGVYEKARHRKWVNLTDSELERAEALAAGEGFSVPRWLLGLVRARLTGAPQFGQKELELLAESNLRLLAIGRNLNQMTRILNGNHLDRSAYRVSLIEDVEKEIRAHTKAVAAVMSANIERWRIK